MTPSDIFACLSYLADQPEPYVGFVCSSDVVDKVRQMALQEAGPNGPIPVYEKPGQVAQLLVFCAHEHLWDYLTHDLTPAFAVFHLAPTKEPAWYGDNDMPITHPTEAEAQAEIEDTEAELRRQAAAGERDPDDVSFGDWVEAVHVAADGTILDMEGNVYGRRE